MKICVINHVSFDEDGNQLCVCVCAHVCVCVHTDAKWHQRLMISEGFCICVNNNLNMCVLKSFCQ